MQLRIAIAPMGLWSICSVVSTRQRKSLTVTSFEGGGHLEREHEV
jgi:hypothetical protein